MLRKALHLPASTIMLVSVLMAAASVAGVLVDRSVLASSRDSALNARRAELRQQQLNLRLNEPDVAALLLALQEPLDALALRLMETLDEAGSMSGIVRLQYQLTPVTPGDAMSANSAPAQHFTAQRLTITAELANGAVLIRLLNRVSEQVRKWPLELQSCLIERQAAGAAPQAAGLQVMCELTLWHQQDLLSS